MVWVLHALTGDSDAATWWPSVVGIDGIADPRKHFIVCANMVGSCYGSSGPLTEDPITNEPWYDRFPQLTRRDIVWFFRALREHLGIEHIALLIGGSTGGRQALEWAFQEPERIGRLVVIAANARHSPWGIAFNESQRMALETDPTFGEDRADAGSAGLAAARALAVLTYRSAASINQYLHDKERGYAGFRAASYLRHQGDKLVPRFNAHSYHLLTPSVCVFIQAYDKDLSILHEGVGLAIRAEAYPERAFKGRIDFLGSMVDPATGSHDSVTGHGFKPRRTASP